MSKPPDRDDLWPNGWQFETDIRLKEEHKDKSIKELKLNVVFLSDEGHVIDTLGKDTATRRYHRHWAVFLKSGSMSRFERSGRTVEFLQTKPTGILGPHDH